MTDDTDFQRDPNDPADPDEVLYHLVVADVEALHRMVLTEGQAELIKVRVAQALSKAINELRGISHVVRFEIRTGIDGTVVHAGEIAVSAKTKKEARKAAIAWVRDNDHHYDDRIDPYVSIVAVTRS